MRGPVLVTMTAGLFLSACASPDAIVRFGAPNAGFAETEKTVRDALGKETAWIQSSQEAAQTAERVHALVHRKTINADTAVQVALLNNRGLQAAYAELGLSAADRWQVTMQPNPVISIGIMGIGADGVGPFRAVEGMIANNLLALATQERRNDIADTRFRQAQLRAAEETLRVAMEARTGWIDAVAAFEAAALVRQAEGTADAASELAAQLGETGFLNKSGQARDQAFHAELAGQRARALLDAQLAKERLTRALGLWGTDVDYFVPDALPKLPAGPSTRPGIEAEALARRVDLAIAKLELEAVAREKRLTDATRFVSDLELIAGFESERETDEATGARETDTTGQIEVEFDIPIFDSGRARLKSAEAAYLRAAHQLAEKAVNVRSEAREAHLALTGAHRIARHYRDTVLPLRRQIEEEALLSYNAMITSPFDLLADIREGLNSSLSEAQARADFWRAEAGLVGAIYGGGTPGGGGGRTVVPQGGGAAEH
ncbi:MAG: Outer membrane protein [Rhodobacteraceae bacterium HLUCCO07]|nr:MAG: Outer membrane protein [Rhodobacteraceae bacterium HLUCCO07]